MTFEETSLNDNILDALYDMRFDKCTPIQEKCIPEILRGSDVLGIAQTGTGKTAAYLLPILSMLDDGTFPPDAVNCLVMSPTRELAQQIDQAFQGFSYYLNDVSSVAVYGGNDGGRYDQELRGLRMGANLVIATPGRLISHINMGNADLSRVAFFILDEADRMLDMGFYDDIMLIASHLPKQRQTMMFSATMPEKIEQLAKSLLHNPVSVKISPSRPAEKIRQQACFCTEEEKIKVVEQLFHDNQLKRVIIFSSSKMKTKQISRALIDRKINCGEMHSDLDQATRNEMMYRFKSGQIDVLVATDIIARGIDIDDIQVVINFDVPRDAEDYVHRIGRTARADRDGQALTLVAPADRQYFKRIEHFIGRRIERTGGNTTVDNEAEQERDVRYTKPRRNDRHHRRQPHPTTTDRKTDRQKNRGTAPKRNKKPNDSGHALSDNKHPRHEKGKKADANRNKRRPDNTKKRRSEQNGHTTQKPVKEAAET